MCVAAVSAYIDLIHHSTAKIDTTEQFYNLFQNDFVSRDNVSHVATFVKAKVPGKILLFFQEVGHHLFATGKGQTLQHPHYQFLYKCILSWVNRASQQKYNNKADRF